GRRRLPAITPPEPRRSLTPPHTHIAQPAHVSSSSSDWIHLDGVLIIARRCRQPLMQRDCVTNEAQEVRYRAVSPVWFGEPSVKSCATIGAILESICPQDFALTNN